VGEDIEEPLSEQIPQFSVFVLASEAAEATLSPWAARVGLSLPSKTGPGLDVGGTVSAAVPWFNEPTATTFFASAGVTIEFGAVQ
jgi:hypothetical protein